MAVSWQDVTDGSQSSRRHLFGPFWGVVERDPDGSRRLWTWSVEREGVADPVAEGFAYDSSVFPCPAYYGAKTSAIGLIAARGRKVTAARSPNLASALWSRLRAGPLPSSSPMVRPAGAPRSNNRRARVRRPLAASRHSRNGRT